jgi:hypothetical protein
MTPPAPSAGDGTPSGRSNQPPRAGDEDVPGVPGFRTWRGVYWFVFIAFVAVVIALTIFSRLYT